MSSSSPVSENCSILNYSNSNSTISPNEILRPNDSNHYIVSECDEELLILIEFKKKATLQNIVFYALKQNNDELEEDRDMSPPKIVHIFKTNHLNLNFDDIESIKSDKTVKCSIKKLNKGQIFKFKDNVKFKHVKYLVIYIKSNQNDAETTYLNGIVLNKDCNEYKFDNTDTENSKKLDLWINALDTTDIEKLRVDSKCLLEPCHLNTASQSKCKLTECIALGRIVSVLKLYHHYIIQQQQKQSNVESISKSDYSNTDLLNDYHHLLFYHSTNDEFEDIYDILVAQTNNGSACALSECLMMKRNHRNRSNHDNLKLNHLYFDNDNKAITEQQLLDRIHSHYLHSFDTGYKIRRMDKKNILRQEIKSNEEDYNVNQSDNNAMHDMITLKIYQFIRNQQKQFQNVAGLQRLTNNINTKFILQTAEQINYNENNYSFGYRYFYWKYYKNNTSLSDEASKFDGFCQPRSNQESTLGDWYVTNKYKDLKHEMLLNAICKVTLSEWNGLVRRAMIHSDTIHVRSIKCARNNTAVYYDMKYKQNIEIDHLIALMIYCNYDELQFKFTQTYRKLDKHETLKAMKQRHAYYYFLGKLLRECVECFGLKRPSTEWRVDNPSKPQIIQHYFYDDWMEVYHGLNESFEFSSVFGHIKHPFSTTTDYCVAVNFCRQKGMILSLNMSQQEWTFSVQDGIEASSTMSCFDCSWISDFTNEQEIFCIGGMRQFRFTSIILASSGINYAPYIRAINKMSNFFTNGDAWQRIQDIPRTEQENQMVYRLLSHELWKYYPNHKYAREFRSCPKYIKKLLHSHC
eukprot:422722_1